MQKTIEYLNHLVHTGINADDFYSIKVIDSAIYMQGNAVPLVMDQIENYFLTKLVYKNGTLILNHHNSDDIHIQFTFTI